MRIQVYIYIFLVIYIFLNLLQLIQQARSLGEDQGSTIKILVWNGSGSCFVTEFPVQFSLPNCSSLDVGQILKIHLSPRHEPAFHSRDDSLPTASLLALRSGEGQRLLAWLSPHEMIVTKTELLSTNRFSALWWSSSLVKIATAFREWMLSPLATLPVAHQVLARKLFIGSLEKLPSDQTEQIQTLGIAHVFAISGFHVSLLFGLLLRSTRLFGRVLRVPLSIGVGCIMLLLAGTAASIVRAVLMLLMLQWVRKRGRHVSLFRVLCLSVLLTLCLKTTWLWDIGWQLSFVAMFTLIWVIPQVDRVSTMIHSRVFRNGRTQTISAKTIIGPIKNTSPGPLCSLWWETFSAVKASSLILLVLVPLLSWHFSTVSLGSVVVMAVGWWLFPLVFSSLMIGLIIQHLAIGGLMYPLIYTITSAILLQVPLEILYSLLASSQLFSGLVFDLSPYLVGIIFVDMVVLGGLVWVDRHQRHHPIPVPELSPLLVTMYGLR